MMITIKIADGDVYRIQKVIDKKNAMNRSDFIRQAIREKLDRVEA